MNALVAEVGMLEESMSEFSCTIHNLFNQFLHWESTAMFVIHIYSFLMERYKCVSQCIRIDTLETSQYRNTFMNSFSPCRKILVHMCIQWQRRGEKMWSFID